jgi:hypothetical protein
MLATARERQRAIHAVEGLAEAVPGKACEYCPLLRTGRCQVNDVNPYAAMNAADRLSYVLFLRSALKNNMVILRDQAKMQVVHTKDANNRQYEAGYVLTERRILPCNDAFFDVLAEHQALTGEDLRDKVNVSRTSLAGLRKAKKRRELDNDLRGIEIIKPSTLFKISRTDSDTTDEESEEVEYQ